MAHINNMLTRIASQTTKVIHSRSAYLSHVTINTAAASAVLTIYNNSAGTGDTVAVIDCSSLSNTRIYKGICPSGITAVMSGGSADVTIATEGPGV